MKTHRWLIALFVIFAGVYLWQILAIPPDQTSIARYQLSNRSAQLVRLSIAVPVLFIWAIAFFGYSRLDRYAALLKKTKEFPIWSSISKGLLLLALSMPITSLFSNWASKTYTNNPELTPRMVILNNYLLLAFLLPAIYYIFRGARLLFLGKLVKRSEWSYGPLYLLVILVIGSAFVYLNFANPARQFPTAHTSVAAYYLPDWLLMVTIIIPYLLVLYSGIKSVEFLHAYRRHVPGKIYKSSLRSLAVGLAVVVLSWIAVRFLTATITYLNAAGLKVVLIMVYILLFMIGIGYSLIARGSTKLAKIEEA